MSIFTKKKSKQQDAKSFLASKKGGAILKEIFNDTLRTITIAVLATTIGMVIDGVVIGKFLGADAMAAYGLAMPVFIVLNAVSGIFDTGAQSYCGNCMGRGNMKAANSAFNTTLFAVIIISVLIGALLIIFVDPIAILLGANPNDSSMVEVFNGTKGYILGLAIGSPLLFVAGILSPLMQLDGDRGRVLPATIAGSAINIIGDFLVAFVLPWGMFGMALMTSISYLGQIIILILHFKKPSTNYKICVKIIDFKGWYNVVLIGLPTAVSRACSTFRSIIINYQLIAVAGSVGVAALSIQSNSYNIFGCVGLALGTTVLMLTNIFAGEQDKSSLRVLVRTSFMASTFLIGGCMLLLIVVAPFVSMIYTSDTEVLEASTTAIRFCAICMPFYGYNIVLQNFCQGTKKIGLSMLICVFDNFIFVVALAFILPTFMGIFGIWMAFVFCEFCMLAMYAIIVMFKRKKMRITFEDIMLLPEDFDVPNKKKFEYTVTDIEDVMMSSVGAEVLCLKNDIDAKRTNVCSLCIEEMAKNIVEHGIKEQDGLFVDIKVMIKGDDIIIRMRDNCLAFNPVDHHKAMDPEEPMSGIGIRMVMQAAKDVNYISTMKLNNLIITI